jgi:hypothetical protein
MQRTVPRMSDHPGTSDNSGTIRLDTTIVEPPYATGSEVELLLFALERSRAQFAWKCGGLDAAALRRPFPPSTMTLGGLIKHVALCEDSKTAEFVIGEPLRPPWSDVAGESVWDWGWTSAADDTPEQLYALWQGAVERSRAAWNRALAVGGLDQASAFRTPSGEAVNLRRVLVDLHDEYARHVGHADLMREAVDGLVGEDPPQR